MQTIKPLNVLGTRGFPVGFAPFEMGSFEGERGDHRLLHETDSGGSQILARPENCSSRHQRYSFYLLFVNRCTNGICIQNDA
jgi:hypothetical protein